MSRRSLNILAGPIDSVLSCPDLSERQDTRPSSSNSLTQPSPVGWSVADGGYFPIRGRVWGRCSVVVCAC